MDTVKKLIKEADPEELEKQYNQTLLLNMTKIQENPSVPHKDDSLDGYSQDYLELNQTQKRPLMLMDENDSIFMT